MQDQESAKNKFPIFIKTGIECNIGSQNFNLNSDLKLLIYSYLSFEEILTIFKNDISTRDKIIRLYFKELPNIDNASEDGNLETIKYLYNKGIKPTSNAIDYASMNGHLNVVKYLYEKGIKPTNYTIYLAGEKGYLEIVKYLFEKGIIPSDYAIDIARHNGHMEVVKYLQSKMI